MLPLKWERLGDTKVGPRKLFPSLSNHGQGGGKNEGTKTIKSKSESDTVN